MRRPRVTSRNTLRIKRPVCRLRLALFIFPFSRTLIINNCISLVEFAVNGTGLPYVDFDIGESYAGNLANTPSGNSSLFFWFFPSTNPLAKDEVCLENDSRQLNSFR